MNRNEFGQLLRTLREEHVAEDGITRWTRKDLARESGLTVNVIGNIELGNMVNLEEDRLVALADALKLTSNERREFFAAASGVSHERIARYEQTPSAGLGSMLKSLESLYTPAFLMDSFGDIIAMNNGCAQLYNICIDEFKNVSQRSATNYNIITIVFAPEFNRLRERIRTGLGASAFEDYDYNMVRLFRALTFQHRVDPYFEILLRQLRTYPLFRQAWNETHYNETDRARDNISIRLDHPTLGPISLWGSASTSVTTDAELKLFSFVPACANAANAVRNIFDNSYGTKIYHLLPNWPKKSFP